MNELLPVVPVKEQPVDSFELVLSQRVAVLVLSGLLQLLPGTGRRPCLDGAQERGFKKAKGEKIHPLQLGCSIASAESPATTWDITALPTSDASFIIIF